MGFSSLISIICCPLIVLSAPLNSLWYDAGLYGAYLSRRYHSSSAEPPALNFIHQTSCDPQYTFLTPEGSSVASPGPLILDSTGGLIWNSSKFGVAKDLKVQTYRGEDFLTFWARSENETDGYGAHYMLDPTYDVVRKITPVGDLEADSHDFNIVGGEVALITLRQRIPADLISVSGPREGYIYDSLFQEIDVASGQLLFQWRSSDHFNVSDSFVSWEDSDGTYDFFRMTAVDKDNSGNYYVSSEHTRTITSIDPAGHVRWILGGKRNQFMDLSDGAATEFGAVHHVRWHQGNILTFFDNGVVNGYSRGVKLQLDTNAMTATLLQEYSSVTHSDPASGGSLQILDTGDVFVDWGFDAGFTQFSEEGEVVCVVRFGALSSFGQGQIGSYRGFKGTWTGRPNTTPDVVLGPGDVAMLWVSWNGATEVAHWRVEVAGEHEEGFQVLATVQKDGFETAIALEEAPEGILWVVALDADGRFLGVSDALDTETGTSISRKWETIEDDDLVPVQHIITACALISLVGVFVWSFNTWGKRYFDFYDEDEDEDEDDHNSSWWGNGWAETSTEDDDVEATEEEEKEVVQRTSSALSPVKSKQSRHTNQRLDEAIVDATTETPPVRFQHKTQSRYLKYRHQEI